MDRFHLVMEALVLVAVILVFLLFYYLVRKANRNTEINLVPFWEKVSVYSPIFTLFRDDKGRLIDHEMVDERWREWLNPKTVNSTELIEQGALKSLDELKGKRGPTVYSFVADHPKRILQITSVPVYDSSGKFNGVVDLVNDVTHQSALEKDYLTSVKDIEFYAKVCADLIDNLYGVTDFKALAAKITYWFGSGATHLWMFEKTESANLRMIPLTGASAYHVEIDRRGAGSFSALVQKTIRGGKGLFVNDKTVGEEEMPFEWKGERKNIWLLPLVSPGQQPVGVMVICNLPDDLQVQPASAKLASSLIGLVVANTQRNKNEQKALLAKQEELQRLGNLMDNLPGVVYTCKNNLQWEMLFLSQGILELTGYDVDEIVNGNMPFVQLIHPDDRARVAREVEMGLMQGNSYRLTYKIQTKNSEVKWVWDRGKAKGFTPSGVQLLEGIIIDITNQVEADRRAQEHQSFINTMVNALPFYINVVNKNGFVKEAGFGGGENKQSVFANQLAGLSVSDIVEPDVVDQMSGVINQVIDQDIVADVEARIIPLNPPRWFESRLVKINNDEALVFSRDITERKQNDAKVAESELLFRSLFDMGNIAMGIVERDLSFSMVNATLSQMLGVPFVEPVGLRWEQIIIPEDIDYDKLLFAKLECGESKSYQGEKRLVKSNGDVVYTHFTLFLLKNDYLQSYKFIASFIDISDRMNFERRVLNTMIDTEEKERMRMSRELHDGVGPLLSSLKMYIQWIQMKESKANKEELMVEAETLIDQTLQTIRDISFNLSPHLLQNYGLVVALESFIAKVKGLGNIDFHFNANGLWGRIKDESEVILYRALTECINNTLKYARAQNVYIDFCVNDGVLCVTYRDDGIGFDPDEVLNRKAGMGLFNMQSRLKAVNGTVRFKSELGKGCYIELEITV